MSKFCFHHHWYRRKQLIHRDLPVEVRSWLFDSSSLTARLKKLCDGRFRVELLSQRVKRPKLDEMKALGLGAGEYALIRQVHLYCEHKKLVFARTVIPLKTLTGVQRQYSRLGSRPLGEMLFKDRSMQRDEVMVSKLVKGNLLYQFVESGNECVWGRRSVFRVSGKPMLVSEFYLPALFEFSEA